MKNAMNAKSGVQKPSTSAIPEQISPSGTSRAKNARPGMATWPRYQRLTDAGAAACCHSLKRLPQVHAIEDRRIEEPAVLGQPLGDEECPERDAGDRQARSLSVQCHDGPLLILIQEHAEETPKQAPVAAHSCASLLDRGAFAPADPLRRRS